MLSMKSVTRRLGWIAVAAAGWCPAHALATLAHATITNRDLVDMALVVLGVLFWIPLSCGFFIVRFARAARQGRKLLWAIAVLVGYLATCWGVAMLVTGSGSNTLRTCVVFLLPALLWAVFYWCFAFWQRAAPGGGD